MIIRAAKQPLLRLVGRQTGVAAAFLVLLANTAFAVLMFHEVRRADDLVVHTQQVTAALLDVRGLVQQAGSNQRTYLLTRDPQFLAIYQQAELDLPRRPPQPGVGQCSPVASRYHAGCRN
jgi:hypothetical protein